MSFPISNPSLSAALIERGYTEPTEVQLAVLQEEAEDRDLLVSAQTGSGKTVAYGLAFAATILGAAERLPRAGETLVGQSFATVSGGKGANQAVAAARLGATVSMIGCVGDDAYGAQLRAALLAEGIDCQAVTVAPGVSSGVALIVVDDNSQNAIVIVAGGNGCLTPEVLKGFDAVLQDADVIICQLEVPMETVGYTLKRGRELGKTVILNPAPASAPLPADWYASIDYLIPNESEASALSGTSRHGTASVPNVADIGKPVGN